jgi:4-amino-4-deoxy-L-arabinose transferase-like glycosyltransferase
LNVLIALSTPQIEELKENRPQPEDPPQAQNRVSLSIYVLALAASISTWFIAIRAPLWLDEVASYFQINAGFSGIWSRQFVGPSFAAYSYILWLSTKLIGTSEIALRVPSVVAMLGAVYLLYLAAREIFERDIAIIAAVVFCLHPIVVFASIDIRPYAFGALATNAAILVIQFGWRRCLASRRHGLSGSTFSLE